MHMDMFYVNLTRITTRNSAVGNVCIINIVLLFVCVIKIK